MKCQTCARPVPAARTRVLPDTRVCIDCAREAERAAVAEARRASAREALSAAWARCARAEARASEPEGRAIR